MQKLSSLLLGRLNAPYSRIVDSIRTPHVTKTLSRQVVNSLRPCSYCRFMQSFARDKHGQTSKFGFPVRCLITEHADRQKRAKVLQFASYGSFGIGGCILLAVILRELEKGKQRIKGIERIKDPLLGRRPKMILYKDVMLPNFVEKTIDDIEKFQVREDDVWIVSYPRSGNRDT